MPDPVYTLGASVSRPGKKAVVLRNEKIVDANLLLDWAEKRLAELQDPEISFRMDASQLSGIRQDPHEIFVLGQEAHVIDTDLGIDVQVVLTEVRPNLDDPDKTKLKFELRKRTLEDFVADVAQATEDIQPTAWLSPVDIPLPVGGAPDPDGSRNIDDWGYPSASAEGSKTGNIDGGQLEAGSIQLAHLATVTEDQSSGGTQKYKVQLRSAVDGTVLNPAVFIENCLVADNAGAELAVADEVIVIAQSFAGVTASQNGLIDNRASTAGSAAFLFYYNTP